MMMKQFFVFYVAQKKVNVMIIMNNGAVLLAMPVKSNRISKKVQM